MDNLYDSDDDDHLFEQTGPYEPITTRIRNILREYKDGVGIFKELIQNADDAGATKVKFLVDWRQGETQSLLTPGMAECQGPALWAYNNAVFSDKDLENITKLAGETKVEDLSKIGRFGLGFNAVYHLTDVPSLVTRKFFIIYDPNTHHLQRRIKDRSRPGIRRNLTEKPESLERHRDQFQPYNGIFGCDTERIRDDFCYKGTLFRFPFRTAQQASTSEISKVAYDRDKIQAIVCSLCECASTLLIFSQHVTEVEIYELERSHQPGQMQLILSVKKPSVQAFRSKGIRDSEPFIKQCSGWWEKSRDSPTSIVEFPSGCQLVTISITKKPSELSRCDSEYSSNKVWFVVSASGTGASLEVARTQEGRAHGLLPCGGAAFVIQRYSEQDSYESYVASDFAGEVFCFLPLSIPTGLPVHVNGYFAIMSNRVEIWKRTLSSNQPVEVLWNEALMEDALARAYIMLLENMKELHGQVEHYEFHTLWPSYDVVDMKSWEKLVAKVCSVLLDQQSKLFYSDRIWMSINEGLILSDDFDEIRETAVEVLRLSDKNVIHLPRKILKTLERYDKYGILQRQTLIFIVFMEQYFFPCIKDFSTAQRDGVLCFALDRMLEGSKPKLFSSMQRNCCIPVSQNREIFAKPCELIHPNGNAAPLYSEDDNRFPFGNGLRDGNRLYVLEQLGMVSDISWKEIHERAQSIAKLGSRAVATERRRKLVEYLNKRIHVVDDLPDPAGYRSRLQHVEFIPALTKPVNDYPLPWKCSKAFLGHHICAPNDLFLPKDANLVGSSCYIVNTSVKSGCGKLSAGVKDLLGFSSRRPDDKYVIQQLDEAIKFWSKLSQEERQEAGKRSAIESICKKIYEFFDQKVVKEENRRFLNELGKRRWLFIQGEFVESKKVAYTSNGNGAPYIFTLPSSYKQGYGHLLRAMQIKHTFDEEDYIGALHELQNATTGRTLSEDQLQIAISFITQMDVETDVVKDNLGQIPLPDTDCILRPSEDIVVNLDLWLTDPDDNIKVHEKIPPQTAHALGAKSLNSVQLKKCSRPFAYGQAFGQHEDLTDRLKGILEGYPPDGVLKELVQNADDAEASEIHFIHDTRNLGTDKVATIKETSKEIQGPALCVYNDRPFTNEDLEGIKHLGIGSKRDSPGMTGKYGIGFNSVYHLTDCPSFLSNDDTLVFLDPHRRYVESDVPGRLFTTEDLRNRSDTLDGYLAHYDFNLKGSTMFRFPLRQNYQSKISDERIKMEELLKTFEKEARKSLLFLNHVKKITLSKIGPNNTFQEIYQVESDITPEDQKKRQEMAQKICALKGTITAKIGWEATNYTMTIKENTKVEERWLIQKCIGSNAITKTSIPDGRKFGLLPRGGLAARLWKRSSKMGKEPAFRGISYCFLPLPLEETNLPVHVNGHFALENNRRGLWTDTDGKEEKSKWNHFMKSCVLPPAYAALIIEAQNYLWTEQTGNQFSRYHALFPTVSHTSPWDTLVVELYRYLGRTKAKVFPLLTPTDSENEATTCDSNLASSLVSTISGVVTKHLKKTDDAPKTPIHFTCARWLSVEQAYFVGFEAKPTDDILHLFLRIGLPVLLHAPYRIHLGFQSAGVLSHEVIPSSVTKFLRRFNHPDSTCKILPLPKKLETTVVKSIEDLSTLIRYCGGSMHNFREGSTSLCLQGLPLLLTQDGYLRVFDSRQPVFGSKFGDLFPAHSHLFVHSELVHQIGLVTVNNKEKIVLDFTVSHLADLLPRLFADQGLQNIEGDVEWKFPTEGVLSQEWFKRLWNYLQHHAKYKRGDDCFLDCLSEWQLIPTKCGKLVKIKDATDVLDMTVTGNELAAQEHVRTFVTKLDCPVLNKEITFENKHSLSVSVSVSEGQAKRKQSAKLERKPAVTDPYVAHPHRVIDVLVVLHKMLSTKKLDTSKVCEDEICDFLQFVQENYKNSERSEKCKQIIQCLPFHKAFDGQYVSLNDQYSSNALIPSGVPTQQLDELQKEVDCLFLSSDALPALERLYSDLGVRAGQNVTQFYVEYVLKHFSMFTRENQIRHLIYIRDKVHQQFPRGHSTDKEIFLNSMIENPCIPDRNGDLHFASEFYDPKNNVFKLFENEHCRFPPSPFHDDDWLDLLHDIGLHVEITPEEFLKFCITVAEEGNRSPRDQQNRERSNVLVNTLFSKTALQEEKFLSKVSQIKFIASAKVDEELTSIHQQYHCQENSYPPFIEFSDAVPWCFRKLAWTTAPLLPDLELPNKMTGFESLGIAITGPAYTKVVHHLQNLASAYNPEVVDISNLLQDITKSIYQFLFISTDCCDRDPTDRCNDVCVDIGVQLKDVPCIFLQDDQVFVKGEQLVFRLSKNTFLKPFLYVVPQELRELKHFLKRLGATSRPKTLQIANVFKAIHDQVGEEILSHEDEKKTNYAMYLLFKYLHRDDEAGAINELYLPSQRKRLIESSKLVCKVSSRYTDIIENLQIPVLLRFEKCKLKKFADEYINALPKHLRPMKFEGIVREVVDPKCKASVCSESEPGSKCHFQQQFEVLLRSEEFQDGLKRLLMEDRQDPEKFEPRIKKLQLQNDVQIQCTGEDSIKIQIILRDTKDVLDDLEESSYAVQDEETWSLYLQHEFQEDKSLAFIATCVNKILGGCINKEMMLCEMLACSSPDEISRKLNKHGITHNWSKSVDNSIPSDDDSESEDESDIETRGRPGEADGPSGGGGRRSGTSSGKGGGARYRYGGYAIGAPGGGGRGGTSSGKGGGTRYRDGGYAIGAPGGGGYRAGDEDMRVFPKSYEEARRWVAQSKIDLQVARWLLQSDTPFSAHACFHSHQVVEKCLKSVLFAASGISGELLESHKVKDLGSKVQEETGLADGIVQLAAKRVERYYLDTRYPNRQPFDVVPAEAFDTHEAEKAIDVASKVLKFAQNYLEDLVE